MTWGTEPQPKSQRGLIIGLSITLVVMSTALLSYVAVRSPSSSSASGSSATSSTDDSSSATPNDYASTTATSGAMPTGKAQKSGWQVVGFQGTKAIYDVPANWTVEKSGTVTGWNDSSGVSVVKLEAVSSIYSGTCNGVKHKIGGAGTTTADGTDAKTAATDLVTTIANANWDTTLDGTSPPKITSSTPWAKTTPFGNGYMTSATVVNSSGPGSSCRATVGNITVITFVSKTGTIAAMVAYSDYDSTQTDFVSNLFTIVESLRKVS